VIVSRSTALGLLRQGNSGEDILYILGMIDKIVSATGWITL